jgi:hypothetical protein
VPKYFYLCATWRHRSCISDLPGETLFECTAKVIPAFYDISNSAFGNMAIAEQRVVNGIILCQVPGLSLKKLFELDQRYGGLSIYIATDPICD